MSAVSGSMKRRDRDFPATMEAPLKNPHVVLSEQVNPFEMMMAAARQKAPWQQQQQQATSAVPAPAAGAAPAAQQQQQATPGPTWAPCTNCGRQQQLSVLHQCESCQDVFCSVCSVSNYDERDVRTFCFDCNTQVAAGSGAANVAASGGGPWFQASAGPASASACPPSVLPPGSVARMGAASQQQQQLLSPSPFHAGNAQLSARHLFASPFSAPSFPSPIVLGMHSPYAVIAGQGM